MELQAKIEEAGHIFGIIWCFYSIAGTTVCQFGILTLMGVMCHD